MEPMASTLRASAGLSIAVLSSRVLGLVREALFAALFGAGALADAYQVAFRIPNLLRDLFAEGALSNAFVPTFAARLERDGKAGAHALGNLVLGGVLLVTGGLSLLGILFAEQVVDAISADFGGDAAKVALTVHLTRWMMPLLALVSASAVWMGMLNAQRRFLVPAMAPAMFNVAILMIGAGLWLWDTTPERALVGWSVGTLAAGAVQGGVQLPALWRLGYRPVPRLAGLRRDPGVRRIVRLMAPAVVGLAAVQLNVFVNTRFAAELGDGPVAQLSYAFRLFYLPIGMFGVALATVTTTRVAEDAARGDRGKMRASTAEGLGAAWMLTGASCVGLVLLAEPVVALIFERGRFTAADTQATALVLQAYVLGLVPYSLVKILAPAFYALDRPRIPLLASVGAVVVNLGFNAATYRALGAPGIALGTTLGALVNFTVLRIAYAKIVGPLPREGRLRRFAALALANLVMAGVVAGTWWGVRQLVATPGVPAAAWLRGAAVLAVIALGASVYVAVLVRLRVAGAELLARLPGALWRRVTGRHKEPAEPPAS